MSVYTTSKRTLVAEWKAESGAGPISECDGWSGDLRQLVWSYCGNQDGVRPAIRRLVLDCRQALPYRIMEELPVTRPESPFLAAVARFAAHCLPAFAQNQRDYE